MKLLTRLRNWLFPRVHTVTIAQDAVEDLCTIAQTSHPKEMLAFFAATKGVQKGRVHIDEIQLQAYAASDDSASVFLSNLPMTTSIIGTVHSHPGGNTQPSDADLQLFSKFGFIHAIVGEPYQPKNICFYNKYGERIVVNIINT
jgi:proteasome lid subunit RPN8/RPN11